MLAPDDCVDFKRCCVSVEDRFANIEKIGFRWRDLSNRLELFLSMFAAEVFEDDATAGKQLNDAVGPF